MIGSSVTHGSDLTVRPLSSLRRSSPDFRLLLGLGRGERFFRRGRTPTPPNRGWMQEASWSSTGDAPDVSTGPPVDSGTRCRGVSRGEIAAGAKPGPAPDRRRCRPKRTCAICGPIHVQRRAIILCCPSQTFRGFGLFVVESFDDDSAADWRRTWAPASNPAQMDVSRGTLATMSRAVPSLFATARLHLNSSLVCCAPPNGGGRKYPSSRFI